MAKRTAIFFFLIFGVVGCGGAYTRPTGAQGAPPAGGTTTGLPTGALTGWNSANFSQVQTVCLPGVSQGVSAASAAASYCLCYASGSSTTFTYANFLTAESASPPPSQLTNIIATCTQTWLQ